jgi:hypothetical protein
MQSNLIDTLFKRISEKIQSVFPSLESLTFVYKSDDEIYYVQDTELIDISIENRVIIQRIRSSSLNFQWIRPEDLISKQNQEYRQLDLLDEFNNRTLLLYFNSSLDKLKNFIAITFPKEVTFLGLQKSIKSLTTEDKNLIGEILHRVCSVDFEIESKHYINQHRIVKYFESKNIDKSIHNGSHIDYIKSVFIHDLKDYSSILVSDEVIEFIIENKLNYSFALNCIIETIDFVNSLQIFNENKLIDLASFKLILDEKSVPTIKSTDKASKIFDLLNRYEMAAQKAESIGMVVNGKTLAENLSPKISPPAITDSIKKNAVKIEKALKEYPSKWMIIRKNIKPIRELDQQGQLYSNLG